MDWKNLRESAVVAFLAIPTDATVLLAAYWALAGDLRTSEPLSKYPDRVLATKHEGALRILCELCLDDQCVAHQELASVTRIPHKQPSSVVIWCRLRKYAKNSRWSFCGQLVIVYSTTRDKTGSERVLFQTCLAVIGKVLVCIKLICLTSSHSSFLSVGKGKRLRQSSLACFSVE